MQRSFAQPAKRLFALLASATIALVLLPAAPAPAALKLVAIPGPNGSEPFESPGGSGPTFVASPPGDTHRVFIGTKDGYVYVIDDGVLESTPFLDLHTRTDTFNENGLFSIAFAPDYATSRRFYVNYSDTAGGANSNEDDHHIVSFQTSASDPNLADVSSERAILTVPALASCGVDSSTSPHYGGQLQFGPDGYLWIAVGDGGDGCSYQNNATDLTNLYGKILRIAPQPSGGYTTPADNPLVGDGGGMRDEIWAYGLRNPWRFSFDPATGDAVVADVGNDLEEEINRAPSTVGTQPLFFGWPCVEGTFVHNASCPAPDPAVAPTLSASGADPLSHGGPFCTAVIGGVVLRDPSLGADYDGRYLYSFFCATRIPANSGRLFTADLAAPAPAARSEGIGAGFGVSSFGVDGCGHPYVTNVVAGGLWRIQGPTPGPCGQHTAPDTTITAAPSGVWRSPSAAFGFASTIEGSSFACSLDGAPATACASATTLTGLGDGWHTLRVTASDEAGNADPSPSSATWLVDTGPPETTIVAAPKAVTATRTAQIGFSASESDVTFACSLDGGAPLPCSSPVSYPPLGDGKRTVRVVATDAAGNVEAAAAEATWTIDTTRLVAKLATTRLRADSRGRIVIGLRAVAQSARGSMTLRHGGVLLGRASRFDVSAGSRSSVRVTLTHEGLRALRRRGSLMLRIAIKLTGTNDLTTTATTQRRVLAPPGRRPTAGLRSNGPGFAGDPAR